MDIANYVLFLLNLALVAVPDTGVIDVIINLLGALHNCAIPCEFVVINKLRSVEYSIELIFAEYDVVENKHHGWIYWKIDKKINRLGIDNIIYFISYYY